MENNPIKLYQYKDVLHVFEISQSEKPLTEGFSFYTLIYNSHINQEPGSPSPKIEDEHLIGEFTNEESLSTNILRVSGRNALFVVANFLRAHFNFVGCRVGAEFIRLQRINRSEVHVKFTIKS